MTIGYDAPAKKPGLMQEMIKKFYAPGKEKVIMDQLMKAYKAYHIVRKVPDQFEFTADFS